MAPKIAVKIPCRAKLKAQEQARYELLKRKASDIAISRAYVATTVGKREASQGEVARTAIAADEVQQTAPSSTSASPSNDLNMVAAADDANRTEPSSTSTSSSNRPNMGETKRFETSNLTEHVLTIATEPPPYWHNCIRAETAKSGTLSLEAGVLSTLIRGVCSKLRHVAMHRTPP